MSKHGFSHEHYRARRDYLLEQSTIQTNLQTLQRNLAMETRRKLQALKDVEQERKQKEAALKNEQAALREKEAERQAREEALQREAAALAELARLKAQMEQATAKG